MIFKGIDVNTIHPAIRLSKEIPPGVDRDIATVEGRNGEIYAGTTKKRAEYRVIVNVAGRTHEQMMSARAAIAAWAAGGLGRLEPTHWPGMAYDAVLERIEAPEKKFGTLTVVFVLPKGEAYETRISKATGSGSLMMRVGGTAGARPAIRQTIATARSSLQWRMNDELLLTYYGNLYTGDVVEMNLKTKSLTVNGVHMESGIDPLNTTYERMFEPGKNNVTSTDGGAMEARWRNEWL